MTDTYDAIVIGGGHNGLVCSALLGKAGKKVLVLEANDRVGGAASTREFAPGYSVSGGAHLLYQLQKAVVSELGFKPALAADAIGTVALGSDGQHVRLSAGSVSGVGESDAQAYAAFRTSMLRYAQLLNGFLNESPPRLGTGNFADLTRLLKMGLGIRGLGRDDMREFLRIVWMNIHDEVVERFEHPLLRGHICLDAVLGSHLGPRSPNTLLTYLYRLAGGRGEAALPLGGMGAISDGLAAAAASAGVTIRTEAVVDKITVRGGRAAGVSTVDGAHYESRVVVSNADPKQTLERLLGAQHLETGFVRRLKHLRYKGDAAKLHLALDGLPSIAGLDDSDYGSRLVIAPDEDYVERAFNPAKYAGFSPEPVLEITIPSYHDRALAPDGRHVVSAVVQYAPYDLAGGWTDAARAAFQSAVMQVLERYAPGIGERVVASELLTPADIETEFRISGGHWHHIELTLDQFLFVRPTFGAAQYEMPVDGLFLCGAGAHPGGGVGGAAGRNAARAILAGQRFA